MPGTLTAGDDGGPLFVRYLDGDVPVVDVVSAEERRIAASAGITMLAGITGSASGGMSIALQTLG